ncbi:hypothetical protein DsansV1_C38g0233011 [Dioscorea sansibarensis]
MVKCEDDSPTLKYNLCYLNNEVALAGPSKPGCIHQVTTPLWYQKDCIPERASLIPGVQEGLSCIQSQR